MNNFLEVVLDFLTMDHLRSKITDLTGIPLENLEVAHVKGNYPFDMHILEVNEELEWNPKVSSLEQWPWMIEDGSMIFYRCVYTNFFLLKRCNGKLTETIVSR